MITKETSDERRIKEDVVYGLGLVAASSSMYVLLSRLGV